MQSIQSSFAFILIFVVSAFNVCRSDDCSNPLKTISVSQSGQAEFKTIQSAIDSVPAGNSQWIHIQISSGVYREQVLIPKSKPCIYFEGAGSDSTSIEWGSHTNATFDIKGSNTIAKGITFTNTLNSPVISNVDVIKAVAFKVHADKCAFYSCSFLGVQDTIHDDDGRHHYKNCYIQGATDFIFGNAQSLFEASTIYFSHGKSGQQLDGVITAHYRKSPDQPTGFVFKNCKIRGEGGYKTELGRAMGPYARVIIANSELSDVVRPEGWSQRAYVGQESTLTFVEEGCWGAGADKSQRVKWMKSLSEPELENFLSLSFIDQEGWISKLPPSIFH